MKAYNLDNSNSILCFGNKQGRFEQIKCASGLKDGSPCTWVPHTQPEGLQTISIEKADSYAYDNSWLARIDTKGICTKGGNGNVSYDAFQAATPPVVIMVGRGALHDSAGRKVGTWQDVLAQVFDGTLLRVEPSKLKPYFLLFERDKVSKLSSEELESLGLSFDIENKVLI